MFRILISGAGIGGLSLAAALEKHDNIEVVVLEKCSHPRAEGAAICLPANATLSLQKLGVLKKLLLRSFKLDYWDVFTDKGKHLHRILSKNFKQKTPFISVERAILHELLVQSCQKTDFIFGSEINKIVEIRGGVKVDFNNSSEMFDLVVGADGVYSKVRQLSFPQVGIQKLGAVCWRAIIKRPSSLEQPCFYMGEQQFLLLHPVNSSNAYCGAIAKTGPSMTGSSLENFKKKYRGFSSPTIDSALSSLVNKEQVLQREIETLSEVTWGKGRTVLIGDASHACAPAMQQGGSQALEDALDLAELITSSNTFVGMAEKLESLRTKRVEFIVNCSNKGTHQAVNMMPSEIFARNELIRKNGLENFNLWHKIFNEITEN
jgi:2-polyprenyl-6-methoxyphenol hydroxylase-like FAD-dependent oxidoreductase